MSKRPPFDLFGPVPLRFLDALHRWEVTYDQFALGAYLCAECYRHNGESIQTTMGLKNACQYPKSPDSLRHDLRALRTAGWIDYEMEERQRRPFTIRLTGLDVQKHTAASGEGLAPQTRDQIPQSAPQSRHPAAPLPEPGSAASPNEAIRSTNGSPPLLSHLFSSGEDELGTTRSVDPPLQQEETWESVRESFQRRHPELFETDGASGHEGDA
jgi:hypothetical protein